MRLSLAAKILPGFAALLASFGLFALYASDQIRDVSEGVRSIKEGHLALARIATRLEVHLKNRFRDLRYVRDDPDPENQQHVLRVGQVYFPDAIRSTIDEGRSIARARLEDPTAETAFFRQVLSRLDHIAEQHEGLDELTRTYAQRLRAEEPTADMLERLKAAEVALHTETFELNAFIGDATKSAVARAEAGERGAQEHLLWAALASVALGVIATFLSVRALRPLGQLVRYARAISRGDYEQRLDASEDELGLLAEELRLMARARKDREAELDRQAAALEAAYRRVDELKRYHESVVRSLRTGIVVTDRELHVTSTNRAAETHWGLAEVRGRALTDLPLGPALVAALGPLPALVERAEPAIAEALPLGELLADVTVAPFQSDRGALLGLVLALEDVTDAVHTKEALIRSERLAAIGRMSAHVTHEIRNPLSSIGLNAEMLLDAFRPGERGLASDEAQQICRSIMREVDRLTAITDDYLRFARLPRPELAATDVRELLSTIATFVRRDLSAAHVELLLELEPFSVDMDADQIRQALLNLVRNAKESMPKGGRLTLGSRVEEGRGALFVRDQGLGIPKENLDRIFDPFYSTKQTGTGLGLALCQQIVTEHGGQLRVRSEVGTGSEFAIVLGSAKTVDGSSTSVPASPGAAGPAVLAS